MGLSQFFDSRNGQCPLLYANHAIKTIRPRQQTGQVACQEQLDSYFCGRCRWPHCLQTSWNGRCDKIGGDAGAVPEQRADPLKSLLAAAGERFGGAAVGGQDLAQTVQVVEQGVENQQTGDARQ